MAVTTVMVVILILWCTITLFHSPVPLPPNPLRHGIILNHESLRLAQRPEKQLAEPFDPVHLAGGFRPLSAGHER